MFQAAASPRPGTGAAAARRLRVASMLARLLPMRRPLGAGSGGALLQAVPTAPKTRHPIAELTQQLDQGVNFSIINSLRTGNMILDMLVCMLVPMAIRYLLLADFGSMVRSLFKPFSAFFGGRTYVRVIEYTEGGNRRFNPALDDVQSLIESTDRNNILQKAIRLYISEKYTIQDYEMESNLISARRVKMEERNDAWGKRSTFSGSYQQLVSFAVHMLPKRGQWTIIDKEQNIHFMQVVQEQQVGSDSNPAMQTKYFVSVGGSSAETVDAWITEAFEWYKEQRKSDQETSRFFYVAVPVETKDSDKNKAKYVFKQYLLSDHKTFRSLFFPEKESLLHLIDQFLANKGKFAIEGFPDKLGLLLDGPPGTGKTSLIKALAHYCNRHVVSVNLAKIKTNQELMDLLFDLVFPVQGGDFPVKMKFQDVIFVMEDVDAASKVVFARDGGKGAAAKKAKAKAKTKKTKKVAAAAPAPDGEAAGGAPAVAEPATSAAPPAAAGAAGGTPAAGAGEAGGAPPDVAGGLRAPPPAMPALLRMLSSKSAMDEEAAEGAGSEPEEEDEEEEDEEEEAPAGDHEADEARKAQAGVLQDLLCTMMAAGGAASDGDKPAGPWVSRLNYQAEDDLNLAGLLNVLDGVVDSPGRIVVMTTNHPDKLDPALIRPGRINKRIHLGYVKPAPMCEMAEHYMLAAPTPEERQRLEALATKLRLTPAQVEQCCAESADIGELIARLTDLH